MTPLIRNAFDEVVFFMVDHPGQTTALQTIVQAMRGAIEDGNDSTKLTQALTENQRLNQLIEKEHEVVLELQNQGGRTDQKQRRDVRRIV